MDIITSLTGDIILIIIGIFIGLLLVAILKDLAIKQQKKINDKKLLGETGGNEKRNNRGK